MHEPWNPDRRASTTAARQHGAISHAQVIACGLSRHQIEHRLRTGRWQRAARGVYVVAGTPDTWQRRAWVGWLADAESDAVVSHFTAGALYGLTRPSLLPHVTLPRARSPRGGVALVHRGVVPYVDRATVDGLRCTSVSRLLVDLAGVLEGPVYLEVVDDALCRKLAAPRSVLDAAARIGGGRRGLVQARRAVDVWSESIEPESVAEARLLRLLGELGLHRLVTQFKVFDDDGRFVARLDLAEPARRRGFEYDGVATHGPRAWLRDEPRYKRLHALGWEVESVTKLDLVPGEPRLRQIVERWTSGTPVLRV